MFLLLSVALMLAGVALMFVPSVSLLVVESEIAGVIVMLGGFALFDLTLFVHTRQRTH